MTARRSAYAEALVRAAGMAATAHDGAPAAAAAPRPRSLFEETWDEAVVDLVPSLEDDMPAVDTAPATRPPWEGGAHPHDLPAHGEVHSYPALPWAQQPVPDTPRPYLSHAPADDGELPPDGAPRAPRPRGVEQVDEAPAGVRPPEESTTHAEPLPPAPRMPSLAASEPAEPAPAPTPSGGIGDGPVPQRAVAAPVGEAGVAAAPVPEVVRAEPVPVVPDAVTPPAGPSAESVPVVVEIERVEVRVVADPPSARPHERRPRSRTGPSLEEYLGGPAGRGTS